MILADTAESEPKASDRADNPDQQDPARMMQIFLPFRNCLSDPHFLARRITIGAFVVK